MRRKWRFRILPEKSRFGRFGPFWSKNGHFWPKINVLANFSKSGHRIFLILHIQTVFWVYFWKTQVKVPGKIWFWPFLSFFGQKYIACGYIIGVFWPFFVDSAPKNGLILMYDFLLEAYGRVVWLSCKKNSGRNFWPLSGGKNGQKWPFLAKNRRSG